PSRAAPPPLSLHDALPIFAARACPWAHRAVITRRLMGLEDAISLGLAGPTHDWKSWTFDLNEDSVDPVLKIGKLRDAYLNRYRADRKSTRLNSSHVSISYA